ncbi:uncharacterized protein TANIYAMA4_2326, partial [Streptococcus canis]
MRAESCLLYTYDEESKITHVDL